MNLPLWIIVTALVVIALVVPAAGWWFFRSRRPPEDEAARERRWRRRRQISDRRDRVRFEPENPDRRNGDVRRDEDRNPFEQDRY